MQTKQIEVKECPTVTAREDGEAGDSAGAKLNSSYLNTDRSPGVAQHSRGSVAHNNLSNTV